MEYQRILPRVGDGIGGFQDKARGFSINAINARSGMQPGSKTETEGPGKTAGGAMMSGMGGAAGGAMIGSMAGGAATAGGAAATGAATGSYAGWYGAAIGAAVGLAAYYLS